MKAVFNKVTLGLMLLAGVVGAVFGGEVSVWGMLFHSAIGLVASLIGSAIGVGVFVVVKRIWQAGLYVRVASATASATLAAGVAGALIWTALMSGPVQADNQAALMVLMVGCYFFGPATIISAIVLGAGAGSARLSISTTPSR